MAKAWIMFKDIGDGKVRIDYQTDTKCDPDKRTRAQETALKTLKILVGGLDKVDLYHKSAHAEEFKKIEDFSGKEFKGVCQICGLQFETKGCTKDKCYHFVSGR